MAIIPRTRENTRMNVSSPVPIGSGDFARAKGEQMEKLGGQMINIGETLYKAEATTKATQASVELDEFYKKARMDAVQTSNADGSNVEEKFKEIVDTGVGAIREKYSGNVLANAKINAFNDNAFKESETVMYAQKMNMASEYHTNAVKEFQLGQRNIIFNSSSAEKPAYLRAALVQNNNLLDSHVQNGIISPANAAKLRDDFQAQLGDSYVDGFVQNKDNGKALALIGAMQNDSQLFNDFTPAEAKKMGYITGQEEEALMAKGEMYKVPVMTAKDKMKSKLTPEEALIMSHLPEAKREQLKSKLEAKMQADNFLRLQDLNHRMEYFEKASAIGAATLDERNRTLKDILTQPNLSEEARARLSAKTVLQFSISEQAKQMIMTPIGQQGKIVDQMEKTADLAIRDLIKANPRFAGMEEDMAVKGVRLEAREKILSTLKNMTEKAKADPALFHKSVDPTAAQLFKGAADAGHTTEGTQALKQYNDYIISRSQYMGIPQRILDDNQIQQFQAGIKSATTPGALNDFMLQEARKYGDHFPRAMTELIASDKEFAPYAALTYANPTKTKPLIDAIKNKPLIDKEFKEGGVYSGQEKLVTLGIEKELVPIRKMFINSMPNTSNLGMVQGIKEAVEIRAKHLMIQNNAKPAEAAKTAYKEIIGDQYHIVEQGKNSILVPKKLDERNSINRTNMIEGFMQVYSQPNNFRELNVGLPDEEVAAGTKAIDYYNTLAPMIRWVTNANQTGVVMMKLDSRTGSMVPVGDKNKRPIEKSFFELHQNPNEKVKQKWSSTGGLSGKLDGITEQQLIGKGSSR